MKVTSAKETLAKGTIKLTVTVPWPAIKEIYEKVLQKKANEIEVSGFRKGKAPPDLVKKQLGQETLLRGTLQEILPQAYAQAVKEHQLRPIIQPKVKVITMEEGKDWQFEAATCEKPKISLGNYQEAVKNGLKTAKIWVPGKEEKEEKKPEGERIKKLFETLLKTVKIGLPQILVEEELNRLLASLLEQIDRLGLTLDGYLNSIKKTVEQLRKEYQERAERTLNLEFIFAAIADDLKIKVEQKEIDEIKKKTKSTANQYYLAAILRRQKTIDKLLNL